MKLLWLCNSAPGVVRSAITGNAVSAVNWVDHVLSGLRAQDVTLRILFRGSGEGALDARCSYCGFGEPLPYEYLPEQEERFREEVRTFRPDVIHSWGVEYNHALAMVNAAEREGMLPRMAASIQGLCRFLAEHYEDGIPEKICKASTFRDLVRRDSIRQQKEKFVLRGGMEAEAIGKLQHVIGRTGWDYARTRELNPRVTYHFCNETLREPFYEGRWEYGRCQKHSVFASSCAYPIKGFHYLLEAFGEVVKAYPDATLHVTGRSFFPEDAASRLRQSGYEAYLARLARKYHLEGRIHFLGSLCAEDMKSAYLNANVFVLPSALENSPNSLGEAMLLGVPCAAHDVGGVRDLMEDGREGCICPSGDIRALAANIGTLFALEDRAEALGTAARSHAQRTHDPEKNLRDLLSIYNQLK